MQIYTREQIERAIDIPDLIAVIEQGLVLYSNNKTTVSSSFLNFTHPPAMSMSSQARSRPMRSMSSKLHRDFITILNSIFLVAMG